MKMFLPSISFIYFYLTFTITLAVEINLEEIFKESQCIPEPSEDFLSLYIGNNEVQNKVDTKPAISKDYRSEINKLVHFNNLEVEYKVENEEGPVHERIFNISLRLGDEIYFGSGKSKKEAKEMAAKEAIEKTSYEKPPVKLKDGDLFNENSTPTVVLNNLGLRHGYKIQYFMFDPMLSRRVINLNLLKEKSQFTNSSFWKVAAHLDEPPKSPFSVEVDVDGQSFFAKAHTIQSAKHEAASKALEYLKQKGMDKNSICTMKGKKYECEEAKLKLKSPISTLYEYAQKMRIFLEFKEMERSGPSHKLIFEFECTLGSEKVYAKGKSKKEAKRKAAELMIENIPDLDLTSDLNDDHTESGTTKLKRRKNKSFVDNSKDLVGNIMNFFSSDDGTEIEEERTDDSNTQSKKKKNNNKLDRWSPKEKLAETSKALNLNVKFYTMNRKNSGFHSVVSMDLNPKYICLGTASNIDVSQEYAALNALKFLHKLDVLTGVEEEELNSERFSFDNYIWLAKEHTEEL